MWEFGHEQGWVLKNWCFQTVVLKKTLESPLDSKEIKPVNLKANQAWIFIGRTEAEVETPNTLATWWEEPTHWKRPWYWERLRAGGEGDDRGWDGWMASPTQWTWVWLGPGVGDGQGGLSFCDSRGYKVLDMTEWLNWTDGSRCHDLTFLNVDLTFVECWK